MRRRLAFILHGSLAIAVLHAQTPVHFNATVNAGTSYIHPVGHGLYFLLDQADGGDWNFKILPSPDTQQSFTDCLESPFLHGPSTIDLTAWRFAPGADAGYAESLPASRQFAFVTNAIDQKYECAEQDAMYNSFQRSQTAGQTPDYSGLKHYKPRPTGHASVAITSLSLKPGLTGQNAEFESVTLDVTITFPREKTIKR